MNQTAIDTEGRSGSLLGTLPRVRSLAGVAASLSLLLASVSGAQAQAIPENAVVGGSDATRTQFPSMVALIDADDSGFFSALARQFCGGTIVASRWVMTAAHCVHNDDGSIIDVAGLRVVENSLDLLEDDIEERVVSTIYVHPGYDHNSIDTRDDIALLEIANELDSQPVELFSGDPEDLANVFATVVGWGATEFDNGVPHSFATNLQQARVPIVTREVCNVPESYNGLIQQGQMCAGFISGGVDSCVGDSGGPLYIQNGNVQVGVTSFGIGCAAPNFYGVYTSVADYRDWIDPLIGAFDPQSPSPNTAPDERSVFDEDGGGATFSLLGVLALVLARRERSRRLTRTPS